jgi:hypothetical protein
MQGQKVIALICAVQDHMPVSQASMRDASKLDLSGQAISSLPNLLNNYKALIDLNISRTNLSSLPAAIGDLHFLASLDASSNQIGELPLELGRLQNLRYLNLMSNRCASACALDERCKGPEHTSGPDP